MDTRPGPLPPGGIPLTEHEPSVFSTQIGEGHTPERPEDHCSVEIHLPLAAIAVDHDFACNPGWTPSSKGPVATLSSQDRGYAFSQSYQANCDLKGWELNIETEATFRYSYETLLALPRTFDLTVEVLHDGVWEEVRDYTLSFTCPWPPPECLEDCEPVPHATELPVPTDDGSSGRTL